MQCYIINLSGDTERMAKMRTALAPHPFISVVRVNAVRGGDLPDIACDMLTSKAEMRNHKGALGSSLSHAVAWEAIVRYGAQASLILEDDSEPERIEFLRDLRMPADIDLVFCNGRMVYQDSGTNLLPLFPAFEFMIRNSTAVGADGYLLSHRGAKKLLEFFSRDGFYSHLDLRLAAYGLTLDEMNALPQQKYVIRDICTLRRIYDFKNHINARVLGTAITRHVKGGGSSRRAEESRGTQSLS